MSSESLHEDKADLSRETRDLHRALVSLTEELDAVDWYRQRAEGCRDDALKEILLHNMREEMEHSAMLIEWLRRRQPDFANVLRTYLFTDQPITAIEAVNEGRPAARATDTPTVGSLKE